MNTKFVNYNQHVHISQKSIVLCSHTVDSMDVHSKFNLVFFCFHVIFFNCFQGVNKVLFTCGKQNKTRRKQIYRQNSNRILVRFRNSFKASEKYGKQLCSLTEWSTLHYTVTVTVQSVAKAKFHAFLISSLDGAEWSASRSGLLWPSNT
jgi:hypothetical protein